MCRSRIFLLFILLCLGLSACSFKAKPAPSAGFVSEEQLLEDERFPFHKAWMAEGFSWDNYSTIYIAPVNTRYLLEMDWIKEIGKGQIPEKDIPFVAETARQAFKMAFAQDRDHKYLVVEEAQSNSIILELALVEIIPNRAFLDTLSYGVPYAGGLLRMGAKSRVAFEARLRDGRTNEVVAAFADREQEKASLVNLKNLAWYWQAQAIIEEWARQFVDIANAGEGETVKDSSFFELAPW
ncbi:MAG: DUF3313 family protein [Candidatus Omnitrophica bacterium]|nr:DUF3313 family protein [Candidatus Omnitrophota bacterium]